MDIHFRLVAIFPFVYLIRTKHTWKENNRAMNVILVAWTASGAVTVRALWIARFYNYLAFKKRDKKRIMHPTSDMQMKIFHLVVALIQSWKPQNAFRVNVYSTCSTTFVGKIFLCFFILRWRYLWFFRWLKWFHIFFVRIISSYFFLILITAVTRANFPSYIL